MLSAIIVLKTLLLCQPGEEWLVEEYVYSCPEGVVRRDRYRRRP